MSVIEVSWFRGSDRVILFEFPDVWDWNDFWDAKSRSDAMTDSVTHNCAILLHMPARVSMPDNALSQGRSLLSKRHPRVTLFVMVTPNAFARNLMRILSQLYVSRRGMLQTAQSLDETAKVLQQMGFVPSENHT
ncbi:MAG: hypothetical protein KME04_10530 [Pleurocapsa minor GSE-CHR-MK-17-07R]|jgi:hypothetical protein|nr:hypothetical protein [Pleurocapsa minor GSE-CHR-MK 17-07R]